MTTTFTQAEVNDMIATGELSPEDAVLLAAEGLDVSGAVDLDDLVPVVIQEGIEINNVEPGCEPVAPPTESDALAKVVTFDQEFNALDPDGKDQLQAIGAEAKDLADPASKASRYVALGAMIHNFLVHRFNLSTGTFKRANELKLVDTTLRIYGVPESMRADHLLAVFHLVKVVRTDSPEDGQPVSYATDAAPAEWFGGNISYRILHLLRTLITRVSDKTSIDCWWYIKGAGVDVAIAGAIDRLRKGELAYAQVKALVTFHQERLAAEAKAKAEASMSQDQIEDAELDRLRNERDSKYIKLNDLMNSMQAFAKKELAQTRDQLATRLAERGVIPQSFGPVSMKTLALVITPGEAKELVEALAELYVQKPDKQKVIGQFFQASRTFVQRQTQATQQTKEHDIVLKVAS